MSTVLIIEPYYIGSHKTWADGLAMNSKSDFHLLTLKGKSWKWRMHGASVTLARQFKDSDIQPDAIIASDMLDLATFKGLAANLLSTTPLCVYFHENQLTYPWSDCDTDRVQNRDNHYGFINYTSALVADKVLFNSKYHLNSFLNALPEFLRQFPDHRNLKTIDQICKKSEVLPLGMNLAELGRLQPAHTSKPHRATILWNHRWEYDKNPTEFFEALFEIQDRGWEFNLIVLGENFKNSPEIFEVARKRLDKQILHWGFVESREEYVKWLWKSDILPVTSNQDFFGGSVVEAMYCNVKPLLPKRLAYPEHIPEFLHDVFFYDQGELIDKLQRWIKDVSVLRKQQTRSFISQYDWSVIGQTYDAVIDSVIGSEHG